VNQPPTPIFEQVLSAVPAALAYVAGDGSVPYENARMAGLATELRDGALQGCAAARERGSTFVEKVHETDGDALIWRFDFHSAAEPGAFVVVGTDVTATRRMEGRLEDLLAYEQSARAQSEQEMYSLAEEKVLLEHVASTDPLTGLVNRRAFSEALDRHIARGAEAGLSVALLYLDLDGFKPINDTLGHAAGDELLVEAAHRLRECVRGEDVAARLGGDEFTLILCEMPPEAAEQVAARVAARAVAALRRPMELSCGVHSVDVSIGVALAAPGTVDAQTLVARADAAMYAAKRAGGGRVQSAPALADAA
jgi:diguanylate cyclase (GGDEF)-like protein